MKTICAVLISFFAVSCQEQSNRAPEAMGNYSNDYVLIEFASKLEEEELQKSSG